MEVESDQSGDLAPNACNACRRNKRKCDKQTPVCSLCLRHKRRCEYAAVYKAPTPENFNALRDEVAELRSLMRRQSNADGVSKTARYGRSSRMADGPSAVISDRSNRSSTTLSPPDNSITVTKVPSWLGRSYFPPAFLLDSNAFEYARSVIQPVHLQVPADVLSALGTSAELREMTEEYFLSVHSYFPIISMIRLYQNLSNPHRESGADVALLFMAMKLTSTEVPEGQHPQTRTYHDVKSLLSHVEAQHGFSLPLIQALLLIGVYEIGHAIHPASYLTVGHAARLGHAMGLHERDAPQMLPRATRWTEEEERRRVWWAVVVLDRFVNIGHRSKPLASADPSLDAHLPTEDQPWDKGQMIVAAPLVLSASLTTEAAPFARTCQAAHLLGKVVRHRNDKSIPLDYRFDEALQLNRTVRALASVLTDEVVHDEASAHPALSTSLAICYSALLELFEGYCCTERTPLNASETQLVMQRESIGGIFEISDTIMVFARRTKTFIETAGLGRISPFVIDALYQAAANFAWTFNESSDARSAQCFVELKELLSVLNKRWRVAEAYTSILDGFWMQAKFGNHPETRALQNDAQNA
nr:putative transcriptional regulatory protein [Quercus suber]